MDVYLSVATDLMSQHNGKYCHSDTGNHRHAHVLNQRKRRCIALLSCHTPCFSEILNMKSHITKSKDCQVY
jgi:hypothetical protein